MSIYYFSNQEKQILRSFLVCYTCNLKHAALTEGLLSDKVRIEMI